MPEEASKKKYAYLDHLSTAELEAILRAAALSEESDDPAMMDYLLEVIVKRGQEAQTLPDVDKMREDFETLYRSLEEPLYPCEESNRTLEVPRQSTPKKRLLRRIVLAAALVGILVAAMCLPIFGYDNVIQMVAYWTAEQFGFRLPESVSPIGSSAETKQVPEEYSELQKIMQENGWELAIPNFPKDFVSNEPILDCSADFKTLDFSVMYQKQNEFFVFSVVKKGEHAVYGSHYEKDNLDAECFEYNGVEYYILQNSKNNIATWYINKIEYSIVTNMSVDMLKEILELSYGE